MMSPEKKKAVILLGLEKFYPLMAGEGQLDRLSDQLVARLTAHEHYLFGVIQALVDGGYEMSVLCESDPLEEDENGEAIISGDPEQIFAWTQEVDECHLMIHKQRGYLGWVFVTNYNDPEESICDYTCGPASTFSEILDNYDD